MYLYVSTSYWSALCHALSHTKNDSLPVLIVQSHPSCPMLCQSSKQQPYISTYTSFSKQSLIWKSNMIDSRKEWLAMQSRRRRYGSARASASDSCARLAMQRGVFIRWACAMMFWSGFLPRLHRFLHSFADLRHLCRCMWRCGSLQLSLRVSYKAQAFLFRHEWPRSVINSTLCRH